MSAAAIGFGVAGLVILAGLVASSFIEGARAKRRQVQPEES